MYKSDRNIYTYIYIHVERENYYMKTIILYEIDLFIGDITWLKWFSKQESKFIYKIYFFLKFVIYLEKIFYICIYT